jgi:hypothetical protein
MDKFVVGLLYKDGLLTLPAAIVQDDLDGYRMMPFQGTPTQEIRDGIISFFKDTSSDSPYFSCWSNQAGGGTYKSATLQDEVPYFWMEAEQQHYLVTPKGMPIKETQEVLKEVYTASSMLCSRVPDPYRDIIGFTYIHDGKLGEAVADKDHNYLGFGEELPDEVIDNLDEPEEHGWRNIVGYHLLSGKGNLNNKGYVWSLVAVGNLLVCTGTGFSEEEKAELHSIIKEELTRVCNEN